MVVVQAPIQGHEGQSQFYLSDFFLHLIDINICGKNVLYCGIAICLYIYLVFWTVPVYQINGSLISFGNICVCVGGSGMNSAIIYPFSPRPLKEKEIIC